MLRNTFMVLAIVALALIVSCSGSTTVAPDTDLDRAVVSGRSDDDLGVAVSPQQFLLSTTQGGYVTVHTAIPYSTVHKFTLQLNGVDVHHSKADLCGNLVAYFSEALIEAIVAPPEAVMTLTGTYTNGEEFSGSDTVKVKD